MKGRGVVGGRDVEMVPRAGPEMRAEESARERAGLSAPLVGMSSKVRWISARTPLDPFGTEGGEVLEMGQTALTPAIQPKGDCPRVAGVECEATEAKLWQIRAEWKCRRVEGSQPIASRYCRSGSRTHLFINGVPSPSITYQNLRNWQVEYSSLRLYCKRYSPLCYVRWRWTIVDEERAARGVSEIKSASHPASSFQVCSRPQHDQLPQRVKLL